MTKPTKEERRAEREERRAEIIRELRLLDEDGLNRRFEESESEMDRHKDIRNHLNEETRENLEDRNENNRQIKEGIIQLEELKIIRNGLNSEVAKLKEKRSEIVREMKAAPEGEVDSLNDAQNEAHKSVERAVARAQEAHERMMEQAKEIDHFREKSSSAHHAWTRTKREADGHHQQFNHERLVYHCIKDLRREIKIAEEKELVEKDAPGRRVKLDELMENIAAIGNAVLRDEICSFYSKDLPKWEFELENLLIYVDTVNIKRGETIRICIVYFNEKLTALLIGRRGQMIKSLIEKLGELLNSDTDMFDLHLLTYENRRKKLGHEGNYSEFLLSFPLEQLKDFAIQRGLSTSGKKVDIANQLSPSENNPPIPKKESSGTKKSETQKLTPPYHWRCRICSTTGQSETLGTHCEVNVRQLSLVSEEAKLWFNKFLDEAAFSFIAPNNLKKMPGMILDSEKLELAIQAGNELQELFSDLDLSCPLKFEVYNPKTDHVRISDLKKKNKKGRGLKPALISSIKYKNEMIPHMKKAPKGAPVEIGHVFDEFLTNMVNSISSDSWNKGEKVKFDCNELGMSVTGTPDLDYRGIPVEMKTAQTLIVKGEEPGENVGTHKRKWKSNYLPQLAMYSDAKDMEWMLLLLISKKTGRFSVIPVNPKTKLEELRREWKEWVKDESMMRKLEQYLEENPNFRI